MSLMDTKYIKWTKIDDLIDKKIQSIRKQEDGLEDPITLSFLQVHEEILLKLKDDLKENLIKESEIKK